MYYCTSQTKKYTADEIKAPEGKIKLLFARHTVWVQMHPTSDTLFILGHHQQ
jgi:hypothetical protein